VLVVERMSPVAGDGGNGMDGKVDCLGGSWCCKPAVGMSGGEGAGGGDPNVAWIGSRWIKGK
jgi:hypothetical protein